MFRYMIAFLFVGLLLVGCSTADTETADSQTDKAEKMATENTSTDFMSFPLTTITGDSTSLDAYKGKVLLLVNTASECGYTPQYAGLQELYETYQDSGLVVIGFPANNFGAQEPGTNEQIAEFCSSKFNVTFPMMAKISVKGDDIHPLYAYLTEQSPFPGEITWNFNKFVVDRDGTVVARFGTKVTPQSDEVVDALEKAL